jgi:hypothetical protein
VKANYCASNLFQHLNRICGGDIYFTTPQMSSLRCYFKTCYFGEGAQNAARKEEEKETSAVKVTSGKGRRVGENSKKESFLFR